MPTLTANQITDPWAGAGSLTSVDVGFGIGGVPQITSTPYPAIVPSARLSSYSQPGFRTAKLLNRPAWMREVYGYREHWGQGDDSSTRVFDVACGGRKSCIDWWLGYATTLIIPAQFDADGNQIAPQTATISRTLPEQHPKYPWLYAQEADLIEPKDLAIVQDPFTVYPQQPPVPPVVVPMIYYVEKIPGAGLGGGPLFLEGAMRYAVTYRAVPYEVLSDAEAANSGFGELSRFVHREYSYAVQAQPIPTSLQFKFTEGPFLNQTIPQQNPQFILPTMQLIYRWVDVPDIPGISIGTCVGKVNSSSFDGAPGWPLYPPETLLCHAPQTKWKRNRNGVVSWEIIYRFDYRPTGWNKFMASDRNFYRAGINGNPNDPLYQLAEMANLFVPPLTP